MRHLVEMLPVVLIAGLACVLALAGAVRARLAPRGTFCPGVSRTWRALLPARWFHVPVCGYDLAGLPATCTCPECGRITRGVRRRLRPLRPGRAALAAAAVAVVMGRDPFWRSGQWLDDLPPLAAISIEHTLGRETPERVRNRNANLAWRARLSAREQRMLARALVRDLAADEQAGNASRAMDLLEVLGATAFPVLLEGLESSDWQTRQGCAHVLREGGASPTPRLLHACVESLMNDRFDRDNARSGALYLRRHSREAEGPLLEGMASTDPQQRFLCAAVAGFAGEASMIETAAPILIEHLRENQFVGDATLAAAALFHFGPAIRGAMEEAARSDDPQVRDTARLILLELDAAAGGPRDEALVKRLNRVTHMTWSPVSVPLEDAGCVWFGRVGGW